MGRLLWAIPLMLLGGTGVKAEVVGDARAYYERAEASYALADYAGAASEYEQAFRLKPQPELLFNAAQAHRLAGHVERALELYVNFLRVYGDRLGNRAVVEKMIGRLREAKAADRATVQAPVESVAPTDGGAIADGGAASDAAEGAEAPRPLPIPASVAPVSNERPRQEPPSLVRRGGFWGIVVGAVVVIAGGVAVGLALSIPGSDPVPGQIISFTGR